MARFKVQFIGKLSILILFSTSNLNSPLFWVTFHSLRWSFDNIPIYFCTSSRMKTFRDWNLIWTRSWTLSSWIELFCHRLTKLSFHFSHRHSEHNWNPLYFYRIWKQLSNLPKIFQLANYFKMCPSIHPAAFDPTMKVAGVWLHISRIESF